MSVRRDAWTLQLRRRQRALLRRLDAKAPPKRGAWMTVDGHRVRRHTRASAVIYNVLRKVLPYQPGKYAFKIEDALRRERLLSGVD